MILGEAVSIDGGVLLLVLLVLVVMLAVGVGLVVGGFLLARRAGEGSTSGLVAWLVIVALELLVLMIGIRELGFVLLVVAILAGQCAMFLRARHRSRPGPP